MVLTHSFQFALGTLDPQETQDRIRTLVTNRTRVTRGRLGVTTEVEDVNLLVHLRVDGMDRWTSVGRAKDEMEIIARVLRLGPNSVTHVQSMAEPNGQDMTREQGRYWAGGLTRAQRREKSQARLDRIRQEAAQCPEQ